MRQHWLNSLLLVLCVIIGVAIAADWLWHFAPLMERRNADLGYLMLIGEANERKDTNDLKGAEMVLNNAIRAYPDRYEAYYELGILADKSGEREAAYTNYLKALQICGSGPTNLVPHSVQLSEKKRILQHLYELTNTPPRSLK
jgi:tetratricopeptide (TPR) repeat protein